jgi:L,D-transpeptidase catalytic domain
MTRSTLSLLGLVGALAVPSAGLAAEIFVSVNKSTQRMTVSVDGQERYSWPVSTGMAGYATPNGSFAASRLVKEHYSREWDNAPMPHSIFFTEAGHAIHGSHATGHLGSPASHGCVRLSLGNAATLFRLVQTEGVGNTRVEVTGIEPIGIGLNGGYSGSRDFGRITSFDTLTAGIMTGGEARHRQQRKRP